VIEKVYSSLNRVPLNSDDRGIDFDGFERVP
jgi:hypothetical protein